MKILHLSTIVTILVIIVSFFIFSNAYAQTGMIEETGYTPGWFLKYGGDSNALSVIRGESNGGSFPNGTGYVDVVFHGYIGEENATQPVTIKTLYKDVVIRTSFVSVSALDINNGTFIFRPHLILYHQNDTYAFQFSYGSQTVMKQYPYVFGTARHMVLSSNYLSPLQQIRDGISPNAIVCDVGLQLVIKSEDDSPACVLPVTATKLILRDWGESLKNATVPVKSINIIGLQNYTVGQPINVTIRYTGYISGGVYPDVEILDMNNSQVWSNCVSMHTETTMQFHYTATYNAQCNDAYPIINKTGTYTMVASLDNKTARAEFAIGKLLTIYNRNCPPCM